MTIYAVARQLGLHDFRHRTERVVFPVMTIHAPLRKDLQVIRFGYMYIMAGGAIHLIGFLKTFAGHQQAVLVTVDIQARQAVHAVRRCRKLIQGVAGLKAEGGFDLFAGARMA